jgi:hypothetical protein
MQRQTLRRRLRRWAGAGAVGLLCTTLLACAAQHPDVATLPCTVEPFVLTDTLNPGAGYLPNAGSSAMDPTGRFMSGYYEKEPGAGTTPTARVVVVWDNGVPQRLDVPGLKALPTGVNEHGWVAGSSIEVRHAPEGEQWLNFGWVAIPGSGGYAVQRLPLLAGWPAGVSTDSGFSINARGEIVGTAGYILRWKPDAAGHYGEPELMSALDSAFAIGINDDGVILGQQGGDRQPTVWRAPNKPQPLALPGNASKGLLHRTRGDWAVGTAQGPEGEQLVRWNIRSGAVDVVATIKNDLITGAVNARGDVAYFASQRLILLRDGESRGLPFFTDASMPSDGYRAGFSWLSDDATVLYGSQSGVDSPLVWHC